MVLRRSLIFVYSPNLSSLELPGSGHENTAFSRDREQTKACRDRHHQLEALARSAFPEYHQIDTHY
jgi:hypothetical protein